MPRAALHVPLQDHVGNSATAAADAVLALINASPRTPTRDELAAVIAARPAELPEGLQPRSNDRDGNRGEAINHLVGEVGTAITVLTEAFDRLERETIERADLQAEVAAGQSRVYVYDRVPEVKRFAGDLRETLEELRAAAPAALVDLTDTALIRMGALDELLARLDPQPSRFIWRDI